MAAFYLIFQAEQYAPSIIFFDEIDGVGSKRGGDGENEASRRMKTILLGEIQGKLLQMIIFIHVTLPLSVVTTLARAKRS